MKSAEVLKIMKISRPTLTNYVKSGKIKVIKKKNGYYDYDEDSVYSFIGQTKKRYNVIYGRVSTYKQRNDLIRQVNRITSHCNDNNIEIETIYQEVASGIDLDRKEFSSMLEQIFERNIKTIYISYKDRLSRLSFITLESMFKQFGTNIVVLEDNQNKYKDELFEELINIIHLFSTKMYSKRRKVLKSI